jgi:hypothetical protein
MGGWPSRRRGREAGEAGQGRISAFGQARARHMYYVD